MGVIQCAVEHCSAPVSCKGWCRAHYRRWQRWGDPLGGRSGPRLCSIDGCDEKHYGLGWSSLRTKDYRDVDVRLILDDNDQVQSMAEANVPEHGSRNPIGLREWSADGS